MMTRTKRKTTHKIIFMIFSIIFSITVSSSLYAELDFPTKPVFISTEASNVAGIIDDSGSMDWELLIEGTGGLVGWDYNTNGIYIQSGSNNYLRGSDQYGYTYAYLWPVGYETDTEAHGRNVYRVPSYGRQVVPPFPQYAFVRSADYNKQYYDPEVTYEPWVDGLDKDGNVYVKADYTQARIEPYSGTSSDTIDLTDEDAFYQQPGSANTGSRYGFNIYNNTAMPVGTQYIEADGDTKSVTSWVHNVGYISNNYTNNNRVIGVRYYPATYYRKNTSDTDYAQYDRDSGSWGWNGGNCNTARPDLYRYFNLLPSANSRNGEWSHASGHALAYDGFCLDRVEIRLDGSEYSNTVGRRDCTANEDGTLCTDEQELQNFANWFSYHRKRHLALRGAMGAVLSEQDNIRFDHISINEGVGSSQQLDMQNLSDDADRESMITSVYSGTGNLGGTPNLAALNYVGNQFDTNTNVIFGACQKNFALQFTDGFSNGTAPSVGNVDGSKGDPYSDNDSNTLADIAMKYYDRQLRATGPAADVLPAGQVSATIGCDAVGAPAYLDCNTNLHMNTYTIAFGVTGSSVYGVTNNDVESVYSGAVPNWDAGNTIDDLFHAAVNGRGDTFSADSPDSLLQSLREAFNSIQAQTGIGSSVSFNSSQIEAGSNIYIATFNSGIWTGNVEEYGLNLSGDIAENSNWEAAGVMDALSDTAVTNDRVVYTMGDSGPSIFTWDKLSASQQDDLRTDILGTVSTEQVAKERLDYIKGDRSNVATNNFRSRDSRLGDIIHSSPVYLAESASDSPNGIGLDGYEVFISGVTASRQPMIYVGANDGMLHAFSTADGSEKMAYIPSDMFSTNEFKGLHYLSNPAYSHHFYVDNTPAIGDVKIGGDWKTVLVGGVRSGGKGLYALDVTDPASFLNTDAAAASTVLWEFTDSDLGYTFSEIQVVRLDDGKWYAVLGNGYNPTSGKAMLYLIDVENPANVFKLDTGAGSSTNINGLATPRLLDVDGDGTVDRAYAGDYLGNMWAFDLDNKVVDYKLFAMGSDHPITTRPVIKENTESPVTDGTDSPNQLVLFGTGSLLTEADKSTTDQQYFMAVWDKGVPLTGTLDSELVEHTISTTLSATPDLTESLRGYSSNEVVDYSVDNGWYVKLNRDANDLGYERISVSPVIINDNVAFVTSIPDTGICADNGSSWLFLVQALTGYPLEDAPFDLNNDGEFDSGDGGSDSGDNTQVGVSLGSLGAATGLAALGNNLYVSGSGSGRPKKIATPSSGSSFSCASEPCEGRFSWEQLINE